MTKSLEEIKADFDELVGETERLLGMAERSKSGAIPVYGIRWSDGRMHPMTWRTAEDAAAYPSPMAVLKATIVRIEPVKGAWLGD